MKWQTSFLALSLCGLVAGVCAAQAAADKQRALAADPFASGPSLTGTKNPAEPGYLGVRADEVPGAAGVRLIGVTPAGPADKSGLKIGDAITSVAGQSVGSMDEFAAVMQGFEVGATVPFVVKRGTEQISVDVHLGRNPKATSTPKMRLGPAPVVVVAAGKPAPLGIRVQAVTDTSQRLLGLSSARGAQVTRVTKDSAADRAGIPVDAIVLSINGQEIATPDDAARIIGQGRAGETLDFQLFENGGPIERKVTIEAATASAPLPSPRPTSPAPGPAAPGGGGLGTRDPLPPAAVAEQVVEGSAARIERLERRVAELEERLGRLQSALDAATGRKD